MGTLQRHKTLRTRVAALATVALGACGTVAAQAPAHPAAGAADSAQEQDEQQRERFHQAMLAYERNHWSLAFLLLSGLADSGHAESARVALQMWHHGPALYRHEFVASARQIGRWTLLWGCAAEATGKECDRELQAHRTP
jgi:hypothetical protein